MKVVHELDSASDLWNADVVSLVLCSKVL